LSGGLFQLPRVVPLSDGAVIPQGQITFTLSGTTTPTDVYTDIDLTTPHPSPVVADSAGVFAPIYLDPEIESGYRVRLETSEGALVYQTDDVFAPGDTAARYDVVGETPEQIFDDTSQADVNDRKFRIIYTNKQALFQFGNAAESVWTTFMSAERDGATLDLVTFDAGPTAFSEARIEAGAHGSFTPSWQGFSSPPTGEVFWEKVADRVTLKFTVSNVGTSSSTSFSMSGLPTEIQPNTASAPRLQCIVIDDGNYIAGAFGFFTPAGRILFYTDDLSTTTGFTASGTKGLPSLAQLTYSIGQ
jgi:hypothetical protein